MALSSGAAPQEQSALASNLVCMSSVLCWAAGFPAAQMLLGRWDPFLLTAARFGLGALTLLAAWLAFGGLRELRAPALRSMLPTALTIGALCFGGAGLLQLLAQAMTDPVTVAVIFTGMPIVGAVLEIALDGRRVTWPLLLGLLVALAGGLVLSGAFVGRGAMALDAERALGLLLALGSITIFCWGSRATARNLGEISQLARSAAAVTGGALFAAAVFPAALALGLAGPATPLAADIGPLVFYGVVGMALTQLLWLRGVKGLGVAVAAMHVNAAPFYVMLFMAALGEPWRWEQAAGAVLVVFGAAIGQSRSRRRAA